MNDNKLLQYMTTSLKDKNKAIKELIENMIVLSSKNKKYKKIIEITTLLLILSMVGNVFMIFLLNH
jgi:hypothetical protein